MFQSTPPRGGRLSVRGVVPPCWRFQSTPPRGGRPCQLQQLRHLRKVSIHAPARGATDLRHLFGSRLVVSIHAPARGATCRLPSSSMRQAGFNPRPRAGGDHRRLNIGDDQRVSIHAPAQGATQSSAAALTDDRVSIHAPAQGATRRGPTASPPSRRFNPRPRAGGDHGLVAVGSVEALVSIHAPAQGATSSASFGENFLRCVSIHAPAQGATR